MKVDFSLTKPETTPNTKCFTYDHSALSEIQSCPTRGMNKYVLKKIMNEEEYDNKALEVGSACHQFFAALRLVKLYMQGYKDHFDFHGKRIFGEVDWSNLQTVIDHDKPPLTWALNFGLLALQLTNFEDSPTDKRRTFSNLETACIHYYNKWDFNIHDVFVQDENDPTSLVGIEMDVSFYMYFREVDILLNYVGILDGLMIDTQTKKLVLQENKTSSRITEDWKQSFYMSHQVTGYYLFAKGLLDVEALCEVIGLCIPLPKTDLDSKGVVFVPCNRVEVNVENFIIWTYDCLDKIVRYSEHPTQVPTNAKACNDYFRVCSYMPYCLSMPEDRAKALKDEMFDFKWAPLMFEKR